MTDDRFAALLQPLTVGAIEAPNRLFMAPLTRNRADADGTPNALMVRYYAQRASAGLIVSEATWVVQQGKPYPRTPGLASDAHRDGWRAVTDAVHAAGGRIVAQLWHGGRVSHPETAGEQPVSASATPFERLTIFTDSQAKAEIPTPRALAREELPGIVAGYVDAARRAIEAGFDGVEVHGANGYLLEQFLADGINHRDDEYGGSPQNRARLTVEVVSAVAAAIGAERTALRISPLHGAHETVERDGGDAHRALADALAPLGLAYVHVLSALDQDELLRDLRERYGAPFVLNSGFAVRTERDEAIAIVADGRADAVAVGRAWIGNPDLLDRWAADAPITRADSKLFYSDGPEGYVDYPTLAQERADEERAA
ncbi:alkene reductase [Patulibacter defluvii]|uniref:alkene reductase n=1 Tax=Patulibacter defluvii TaxID=3095358 RepID=UPI002A764276|nr:alkene reductase [Patulibacter sp. DM4]